MTSMRPARVDTDAAPPGLRERHAVDGGQDVQPVGRPAEHETLPGVASSSTSRQTDVKPKSTSAARSRRAFAFVGSTKTSRSSVWRGRAWIATACPPTRTKRTRWRVSNLKSSFQSADRASMEREGSAPDDLDPGEPLESGPVRPGVALDGVRAREVGHGEHACDHATSIAAAREPSNSSRPRRVLPRRVEAGGRTLAADVAGPVVAGSSRGTRASRARAARGGQSSGRASVRTQMEPNPPASSMLAGVR